MYKLVMIDVRLKNDCLEELRKKYNTNTLGKLLNYETAFKLLKEGNANITMRNFCKLCELMGWPLPDEVEISDSDE